MYVYVGIYILFLA